MSIIIVNPTQCAFSGKKFDTSNTCVIFKCGCALGSQTALANVNEKGFVYCPNCEFAYTVKRKEDLLANDKLEEKHIEAVLGRCTKFEKEIEALRARLDQMVMDEEPEITAEEQELDFLTIEDDSDVADSSEDDAEDFTAFESTTYAILQRRLFKLKQKRDDLTAKVKETKLMGTRMGAPWAEDSSWTYSAGTPGDLKAQAAKKRRADRKTQRDQIFKDREARRGASKVVHNIHVLNKEVPRRWAKDDPNAEKPSDWEEQARAKQGWLTADEQENLDEEEQEKLTKERREAWRAQQSKVPKLYGSVARQRWANRLYKLARQRHWIGEKIAKLKEERNETQVKLWTLRRDGYEARVLQTQTSIDQRVAKMKKTDAAKSAALCKYFEDATRIGIEEIDAEIAAREKAKEEARLKAEQEAAAAAKAEAKAKAKAEAEARGEEWVDPDGEAEEEED